MEDSQIIKQFLESGNAELFEMLVDRYKERVFRLALSILGTEFPAEAEEVAQEVFVNVYRSLPSFRMESQFGSWLYRITYNRAIDERRKSRYRLPHEREDVLERQPSDRRGSNPHSDLAEAERRDRIQACLDDLPDTYRAVIYLFYWMDYSINEIGETLCMNIGTVKSYMHRARLRMSELMQEKGIGHGQGMS